MQIKDITNYLESLAPIGTAESYDNCGLLVGDFSTEVTQTLLTLDCTEEIVDEAIEQGCNLIIAHHPIVFGGQKKLNGKNYVERTVIKAIKNDIAIYAIHTNLDNYRFGVNFEIGKRLGLQNLTVLSPKKQQLKKLVVFVPTESKEKVLKALFDEGAGNIGNYAHCSFETEGKGGFLPLSGSSPQRGEIGQREVVKETKVEVLVEKEKLNSVLNALFSSHPYEEVAYDIISLENEHNYLGSGMFGELENAVNTVDFLTTLKKVFNCGIIKHTALCKNEIKTVAFCGGAGSFLLSDAKRKKADIFITGDYKYHEFFDAENQLIIADIGHYESEQYTPHLLARILKEKFANFAVRLTGKNTNPIKYF
ncbi:MAG: Nif3-like dinuclear metal center hexameric protein [Lishizhenia sp.]